jgi:hypothetical protein
LNFSHRPSICQHFALLSLLKNLGGALSGNLSHTAAVIGHNRMRPTGRLKQYRHSAGAHEGAMYGFRREGFSLSSAARGALSVAFVQGFFFILHLRFKTISSAPA